MGVAFAYAYAAVESVPLVQRGAVPPALRLAPLARLAARLHLLQLRMPDDDRVRRYLAVPEGAAPLGDGICGRQLQLAILIARLVSLEVAQSMMKEREQDVRIIF